MTTLSGILELPKGAEGRIRQLVDRLIEKQDDPFVPQELAQRYSLRQGQRLTVSVIEKKSRRRRGKGPRPSRPIVEEVIEIEGLPPREYADRKSFEELTAVDPQPRVTLEYPGCPAACRLIDLFCPIGYGTRGLIVSPPKAGKTILLQNIATGIKHNHPDIETHVSLGILSIERAKRMLEAGKDVVVLLDSLTRLGRAFNNCKRYSSSGRTMSGGLDSRALEIPKQLFGGARRAEEGGSLTIIASCLVDTGSRADQIIFEEFKGTGNMELILDRSIAEQRLFPAINLAASGTRKEHLLMGEAELKTVTALRRRLMNMKPAQQIQQLLLALRRYKTNEELVHG
jgi:transcription termination factor Rho